VEISQLDRPSAQIHVLILIWLRADLEKSSCFLCSGVVLKLGDMGCKSLYTYRREDLDVSFFGALRGRAAPDDAKGCRDPSLPL
jgi:hypothetical protein